jgi:hypothetical protein
LLPAVDEVIGVVDIDDTESGVMRSMRPIPMR